MTISNRWTICFERRAFKELSKLDRPIQKKIHIFLHEKVIPAHDPKQFAKPLSANLKSFWRFRVEDFRLICHIQDNILTIVIMRIAHRRTVYD